MKKEQIKVGSVDDELIALNRLSLLLQQFPEIEIIHKINNVSTAFDIIVNYEPALLFLDVEMPGITGLELAEELQKNLIYSKIIFVTSHNHYAFFLIASIA